MARNTLILGAITAAGGGLGLFSVFLISTISGVGVYGKYAMVLAITTLVSNLAKLGLDAHIMKHCPPVIADQGPWVALHYLRINATILGGAALCGLVISQVLAGVFVGPAMSGMAFAISLAASGLLLKVVVATLLRAQGGILLSQYFLRLSDILFFVLFILAASVIGGFGVLGIAHLTLLWASAIILNLLLASLVFVRRSTQGRPSGASINVPQFKPVFSELFYFSAVNAMATMLQTVDVLLIGYLTDDSKVGIFSILKRSVNQIYVILGLFQIQYWGELSVASARSDRASIQAILRRARRAVSLSLPPLCLLATGVAWFLLIRASVSITTHLILIFGILMLAMVINSLFLFVATLANLNGMERLLFLTMASGGVVYFGLLVLGDGNLLIASIAFLIYQVAVNATLAVQLYRRRNIHLFATE